MATASYAPVPPQLVDGWSLIEATPTLKFYRNNTTIVVAIRGTNPSDTRDLEADAKIPLNKLETTARYHSDRTALLNVMKRYPTSEFDYYGVGHSLGGAILDAFIREGWIRNGVSYNPAVQPKHFSSPIPNSRIYQSGDPLYKVFGQFTPNAEVRPPKKVSPLEALVRKVPYVGSLFGLYRDHQLSNFEGGGTHRENVFKRYDLKDDGYSVAELATITGVPKATLQDVYNRGIGAYKTNPTSVRMKGSFKKNVDAPMSRKLRKEQWAMARVYSFLDGNPKHDADLRGKGDSDEETDGSEESVEGRCGYYALETLRDAGYSEIVVEPGQRGAVADSVLETAVAPYKVGKVATKTDAEILSGVDVQELLQQMREEGMSGLMFLVSNPEDEGGIDHVVPIVFHKGEVFFHDEGNVQRIDTSLPFYRNPWWERGAYDDEYDGVDKLIALLPKQIGKGSAGASRFLRELKEDGLTPTAYLREARRRATASGYDAKRLAFADDGVHKLAMTDEKGRQTKFGRVGYRDHLMWSHLERQGSVPAGTAEAKQRRFQTSHRAMKGDWKSNPYSANRLALAVLW